ncbi:MAG: glycosyltransferase family 39 protein [Candidatus Omnitrophota bacterium]
MRKTLKYFLIAAILIFSLAIRLYKIDTNLPHLYWHDENNSVETALRFSAGNLRPQTFQHGMLLSLTLAGEYAAYYGIRFFTGIYHSPTDLLKEYLMNPTNFYLISRITTSLFGIASILLIYSICLKLYNNRTALLASLFFSLSFLPFVMSKWTKEDPLSVFFLLSALLMCAHLLRRCDDGKDPKIRFYNLAGLFVGLASAAKYYSFFGIVFIFLTHLYIYRAGIQRGKRMNFLLYCFDIKLIMSGLFFIIGFAAGNIYAVIDPRFFYTDVTTMSGQLFYPEAASWTRYFTDHLKDAMGSGLLEILALISSIFFIMKRSKKEMLLLSYPAVMYLFYMKYTGFAHYMIPVVPFMCIITAAFFNVILTKTPRRGMRYFAAGIIIIALVPSLLNILRYNALTSRPDTRTIASAWIEKNVPENATILSEGHISTAPVHVPQLRGNMDTLKRDLSLVLSSGGGGTLIREEMNLAQTDRRQKRYDIYRMTTLDAVQIGTVNADYVILTGFHDMDVAQMEYHKGRDFYSKRKAACDKLEEEYILIKEFVPFPRLSFFFPIFLIGDLKKMESIDPFKSQEQLLQGPDIKIYFRKNLIKQENV